MSDKLLMLKADYKRLAAEKDGLYAEYGKLKKQLREYDTVKQNIDSILHATQAVSYTHLDVYKRQWRDTAASLQA